MSIGLLKLGSVPGWSITSMLSTLSVPTFKQGVTLFASQGAQLRFIAIYRALGGGVAETADRCSAWVEAVHIISTSFDKKGCACDRLLCLT